MSQEIYVPDLGNIAEALVIDLPVAEGQEVAQDDTLLTLESDKAAMDIPVPVNGIIAKLFVKKGDKLKTGALIAALQVAGASSSDAPATDAPPDSKKPIAAEKPSVAAPLDPPFTIEKTVAESQSSLADLPYAGPAVRQLAMTLGVDLQQVRGTGHKGRITRDDVARYLKQEMGGSGGAGIGADWLSPPAIDYSQWGPVRSVPLSRIKQRSAQHLQQAALQVPRVTHVDEADITELEAFRKLQVQTHKVKMSLLPFILKAYAHVLNAFPSFNASLNPAVDALIYKEYVHLGVAVDTEQGLVVPVIRDVDSKGVLQLAHELTQAGEKARQGKLLPQDFQGSSSTVSSLGGIGGTVFTPIVNMPNVAILGVCRSSIKPVYQDGQFVPRLLLPLSLSYDHRAIDGAEAARFMVKLCQILGDMRQALL